MKTADQLKKVSEKIRAQAKSETTVKCSQVVSALTGLKLLQNTLKTQEM